jgi:hypothetical protein
VEIFPIIIQFKQTWKGQELSAGEHYHNEVSKKITIRILSYELIPLGTLTSMHKKFKHVSINVFLHSRRKPEVDGISHKKKYAWHLNRSMKVAVQGPIKAYPVFIHSFMPGI